MSLERADPSGTVFDIQHYAVHDGPGIRTLVFLKGCPLRCLWCCNPESQSLEPELRHSSVRCKSCLRCLDLCERGAVRPGIDGPVIDRTLCASCELRPCVEGCWQSALKVSGERMTATQVVSRVVKDLDFYRNSGGGVTVSGGEPFFQPAFLLSILKGCRELGIHTAVETCGLGRNSDFLQAAPLVDLFLFDVKVVDPEEHQRMTAVSNEFILSNLRTLTRIDPCKVHLRFPVIPGYTDSLQNVEALAALMIEVGVLRVELQPYHSLGLFKYAETGRPPPLDAQPTTGLLDRLDWIREVMACRGIECGLGRE